MYGTGTGTGTGTFLKLISGTGRERDFRRVPFPQVDPFPCKALLILLLRKETELYR